VFLAGTDSPKAELLTAGPYTDQYQNNDRQLISHATASVSVLTLGGNYFMSRYCNHRRFRMIVLGVSCVVFFACAGIVDAKTYSDGKLTVVRLNRNFKLKAGQRVNLRGTNLRIKFLTVETDSRCPSDVKCVWAGNAAVQFQLSNGRGNKTVTLNTGGANFVSEVEYRDYKVKLVDLSPYPRSDRQVAASDYAATLFVSKN
jgi:hypothetical protein